jgi:hypothetical protein
MVLILLDDFFRRPPMLILSFHRDSAHHSNRCGAMQQNSIEVRQCQRPRQKYNEEIKWKLGGNTASACLPGETNGIVKLNCQSTVLLHDSRYDVLLMLACVPGIPVEKTLYPFA